MTEPRDAQPASKTADEPAVEVRDLVARYGDTTILDGVNLLVESGEVRLILGGSGSGKTTLLKNIIGLVPPAEGTVRLLGVELDDADEPARQAVSRRIGMLFQGSALLNSLSIHENVALPLVEEGMLPRDIIDEVVRMKLGLVGLEKAAHLLPSEISGGMKKRAGLARAMALDPDILFCDEPGAGLDPVTAAHLDQLLLGLVKSFGMTLVVVSHELASIRRIAEKVIMLHGGEVIADGLLAEVEASDEPVVRSFFQGPEAEDHTQMSVYDALARRPS
jgi:phospholipid/cholesterol/gamma-HCH transport system ATP-binding protein